MTRAGTAWSGMEWLNPPEDWSVEGGALRMVTDHGGDFWRHTFYGFEPDGGHAFLDRREGAFAAEVTVDADYRDLYDQAGLMLRLSPTAWVKAGVEWTDGAPALSVVVTDGASDWSKRALPAPGPVTLRIARWADAGKVEHLTPAGAEMIRLFPLRPGPAWIGPMACSPQGGGMEARFDGWRVEPDPPRAIH